MNKNLPTKVYTLIRKFTDSGFQIYIVGGAIRDLLLGKQVKDWDFTTDATPEQILEIFPNGFYNNQFGTVGVQIRSERSDQIRNNQNSDLIRSHPISSDQIFEITTMRKEGLYEDSRHPTKLEWTNNIEQDLARRDFTINAMALGGTDPNNLKLVDPFNGKDDLKNKIIKAVGDPNIRFLEDALRLIRAIRFATQLQFVIDESTFAAIKENAFKLQDISWERIRDEFFRILTSDYPYEGVVMLRSSGLLEYILPELEKCFGTKQEGPKHDRIYDIGEHSLLSLKFCPSKDPVVRFAALIHDIGKPDTANIQSDGNVTFYQHEIVGANIARKIAERLRLSKNQKDLLVTLVRYHLFTVDEKQTDSALRRFIKNVGIENLDHMFAVREADRLGGGTKNKTSWRTEEFKQRIKKLLVKPFTVSDLKVNGNDVMQILNIPPSRKVGEILDQLFQEVLEDHTKNEREYLLRRIKQITN